MQEEIEPGHACIRDLLRNPHGRRVHKVTKDIAGDVYLLAKKLSVGDRGTTENDQEEVLQVDKVKLPSKWADDMNEVSVDSCTEDEFHGLELSVHGKMSMYKGGYDTKLRGMGESMR